MCWPGWSLWAYIILRQCVCFKWSCRWGVQTLFAALIWGLLTYLIICLHNHVHKVLSTNPQRWGFVMFFCLGTPNLQYDVFWSFNSIAMVCAIHGVIWSLLCSLSCKNKFASLGGSDETSESFKTNAIVWSGRLLHFVCMWVVVFASWCVCVLVLVFHLITSQPIDQCVCYCTTFWLLVVCVSLCFTWLWFCFVGMSAWMFLLVWLFVNLCVGFYICLSGLILSVCLVLCVPLPATAKQQTATITSIRHAME